MNKVKVMCGDEDSLERECCFYMGCDWVLKKST